MKRGALPTLSNKERVILELLVSGPKYGLELVDDSRGALKRGTVYVTLGRMEQKGLVESRHEKDARSADRPQRRMYHVTAHGRRVLDAWTIVARTLAMEAGL
jgi:PadR family transcriptional regulator, regulatory protein PadR